MKDLIDELAEIIYVVDLDTYELQFINETGKKRFEIADISDRKCYDVLYGKQEPCAFCNNCRLTEGDFITWECDNEKVGCHYLLKDALIDWNGKKAKVEIACDITKQEEQKKELQMMSDSQKLIIDCVQKLHGTDNILEVLDDVAMMMGSFLQARRTYIYVNCPDEGVEGAHIWYEDGVPEDERDGVGEECGMSWRRNVLFGGQNGGVTVRDVKLLRSSNPIACAAMEAKGITRIAAAPLELEKDCIGYIEIDNPPEEQLEKIVPLLSTLAYFISSCMCICKNRRRLERMNYTDSLTGVGNRNAYSRFLNDFDGGDSAGVGVVYIDINDMKGINDRYGHAYGDHVLVNLSDRLATYFPLEAVFRIDGDEFVILCQNVTKAEFRENVRAFISDVEEQNRFVISVGYKWSENGKSIENLIDASDRMMYENKKGYYFSHPMPGHCRYQCEEVRELLDITTLERKLAEGSFPVYLQPKMSVNGRRLIGAEALVRYRNDAGKLVFPDHFIPILEDNKLIDVVDFYVFDYICRQMRQWREHGIPAIPISVNFSRYTLMDVNFLDWMERTADRYGVDRRLIEIEVTESADTDEGFDLLGFIKKIREAGFKVSIDDFGVKYANLFLFATVDFDALKIDKCLSKDLENNEKARAILLAVSDICKRMGISMIVEGIETEEQLHVLEQMGCYGVQGYLFSCPIPIPEFERRYLVKGLDKQRRRCPA